MIFNEIYRIFRGPHNFKTLFLALSSIHVTNMSWQQWEHKLLYQQFFCLNAFC